VFRSGLRSRSRPRPKPPENQSNSQHDPKAGPSRQGDAAGSGEQNQQCTKKQHDEFVQEAEKGSGRSHGQVPMNRIIAYAAAGPQILGRALGKPADWSLPREMLQ
jgi:hypothetical protein